MSFGIDQYADKRDEASVGHIVHQQMVEPIHVASQILFLGRCPGIGPAYCCHQSRTDAMTGYVGKRNQDSLVREHLPIEVVAASFISGATPSSDVITWHVGLG